MPDTITLEELHGQYLRLLDRARRAWPATGSFQVAASDRATPEEIAAHISTIERAIAAIEDALNLHSKK